MTLRVFISSTSELSRYRGAAREVCERLAMMPIGMETFNPMGYGATAASRMKLDEADVYVGIVAWRYGHVEDGYALSVTAEEHRYAGERGIERLCFLADSDHDWPIAYVDPDRRLIDQFRSELERELRGHFSTVDNFGAMLTSALVEWKSRYTDAAAKDRYVPTATRKVPSVSQEDPPQVPQSLFAQAGGVRRRTLLVSGAALASIAGGIVVVTRLGVPVLENGTDQTTSVETPTPNSNHEANHRTIGAHSGPVVAVATATLAGRPVVISGSEDRTLKVWDLATGEVVMNLLTGSPIQSPRNNIAPVLAVAVGEFPIAELDRQVVASTGDGGAVNVWDLTTGEPLHPPLVGHKGIVRAIVVATLDGQGVIVTGGDDESIIVWDPGKGTPLRKISRYHDSGVSSLAIAELGSDVIIVSGSYDKRVSLSKLADGKFVNASPQLPQPIYTVATQLLHNDPVIVTGGGERIVRAWDLRSGRNTREDQVMQHSGAVRAVATTDLNGEIVIISASSDSTLRVWDLADAAARSMPLSGHSGSVNSVAVADLDGRKVAVSGGDDKTIRVWDLSAYVSS